MTSAARVVRVTTLVLAVLLAVPALLAAPVVTQLSFRSPAHAQPGEPVVIQGLGFAAPVQVWFSDGTSPTVAATVVYSDALRGMVFLYVPAAAKTGNMKLRANGVDAAPYWFRADAGTFTPGTSVLTGTVTGGGSPVQGAAVILLRDTGCNNTDVIAAAVTDASGNYTINAAPGSYMLFVWPPSAGTLASISDSATLGAAPVTKNFALVAGTTVTGSIVEAGTSTPIAKTTVAMEGNVYDQRITDASGNFSFQLMPGSYRLTPTPPPGDAHIGIRQDVNVGSTSPQPLGPQSLALGVLINGNVLTSTGSLPLPGGRVHAWQSGVPTNSTYDTTVLGDGSYALAVPPNTNYDLGTNLDDDSSFVDAMVQNFPVGAGNASKSWSIGDAARIKGTVLDKGSNLPLDQFQMQLRDSQNGNYLGWAQTCSDGHYTLRVAPGTGVVVEAGGGNETAYAFQAWNNTADGTPYWCEGQKITPSPAGSVTSNINFKLVPEAVITGHFYTAATSCTGTVQVNGVSVDDGSSHNCSLGNSDWNAPAGTYRAYGLPPNTVLPGLRVCAYPQGLSPQCYNRRVQPSYNAVSVGPSSVASNIDFCLGSRPTHTVVNLTAQRQGGNVQFSWSPSSDLYHDHYVLRASTTARPHSGGGSFPSDPSFPMVSTSYSTQTSIPGGASGTFYLVTDAGVNGEEGPSGSYGN